MEPRGKSASRQRVRNDLSLYERESADWWNPRAASFRSLHGVKRYHLEALLAAWPSLHGATVVDLGCGGGLLAVPLAERGAAVIGVDSSQGSLRAARAEAGRRGVAGRWICADVRWAPLPGACADYAILSDVVEHVTPLAAVVGEAARLLRPGGRLFVNTINRTWIARLLAVAVAERVRLVPPGTHDPALFVRPDELLAAARTCGLQVEAVRGERPRLLDTLRGWAIRLRPSRGLALTYSAFFAKEGA